MGKLFLALMALSVAVLIGLSVWVMIALCTSLMSGSSQPSARLQAHGIPAPYRTSRDRDMFYSSGSMRLFGVSYETNN
jgi:hypothetical protein